MGYPFEGYVCKACGDDMCEACEIEYSLRDTIEKQGDMDDLLFVKIMNVIIPRIDSYNAKKDRATETLKQYKEEKRYD